MAQSGHGGQAGKIGVVDHHHNVVDDDFEDDACRQTALTLMLAHCVSDKRHVHAGPALLGQTASEHYLVSTFPHLLRHSMCFRIMGVHTSVYITEALVLYSDSVFKFEKRGFFNPNPKW